MPDGAFDSFHLPTQNRVLCWCELLHSYQAQDHAIGIEDQREAIILQESEAEGALVESSRSTSIGDGYEADDVRRSEHERLGVAEVDHHGRGTEPVCLVADVQDSNREPDTTHGFGDEVEINPDEAAEKESNYRQ